MEKEHAQRCVQLYSMVCMRSYFPSEAQWVLQSINQYSIHQSMLVESRQKDLTTINPLNIHMSYVVKSAVSSKFLVEVVVCCIDLEESSTDGSKSEQTRSSHWLSSASNEGSRSCWRRCTGTWDSSSWGNGAVWGGDNGGHGGDEEVWELHIEGLRFVFEKTSMVYSGCVVEDLGLRSIVRLDMKSELLDYVNCWLIEDRREQRFYHDLSIPLPHNLINSRTCRSNSSSITQSAWVVSSHLLHYLQGFMPALCQDTHTFWVEKWRSSSISSNW